MQTLKLFRIMSRGRSRSLGGAVVVGALCALIFATGCSKVASKAPKEWGVNPTTAGVATGAVVGAGLGAVIGSATGDAGSGLAIGTLAGAAIGGGVGHEFHEQEKSQVALSERANRQDELIDAQQRELEELRRRLGDQAEISNRPSLERNDYSFDSYSGNPEARRYPSSIQDEDLVRDDTGISGRRYEPVGRTYEFKPSSELPPPNTENVVGAVDAPQVSMQAAQRIAQPVERTVSSYPPPAEREVLSKPIERAPLETTESSEVESEEPIFLRNDEKFAEEGIAPPVTVVGSSAAVAPKVEPKTAKVIEVAKVAPPVNVNLDTDGCRRAEAEAERAEIATSDADKLFYLRRALRLCPNNSEYHVSAGSVYLAIGRPDDAKVEFEQAVSLDPNNEQAKQQLSSLEPRYRNN